MGVTTKKNNLDLNEEVSEMFLKCGNILIQREETFNQYAHLLSEIDKVITRVLSIFPRNTTLARHYYLRL